MTIDFSFVGAGPPAGLDFSFAPQVVDIDVEVAFSIPGPALQVSIDEPRAIEFAATLSLPTVVAQISRDKDVALVFERPATTSGDLVFGEGENVAPEAVITVVATMPPPTLAAFLRPIVDVSVLAALPGPALAAVAIYASNTQRPTVGQRVAPWQVADKPNQPGVEAGHRDAAHGPTGWAAFWERATSAPAGIEHRLPDVLKAAPVDHLVRFQDATGVHGGAHFLHQDATRMHARRDGVFQDGSKVRGSTDFRHQDGDRTKRPSRRVLWQDAQALRAIRGTDFQGATPSPYGWAGRFQDGVPPPPGLSLRPVDPPQPPGCYTPDPNLLFSWPWVNGSPHLVFQCGDYSPDPEPGGTVVVPIKEVYLTINNATLFRLDTGQIVPATGMSMSLDVDSWTWSFSAAVGGDALSIVQPNSNGDPVVVQASINGVPYRFLVEKIGRERAFNSSRLRISGRGLGAALDDPYAAVQGFGNTSERTAQQLMADILTVNGVPMGWTVDWGITDWLVPANVFSHQGTYQTAINAIANAVGAYIQPHNTENRFSVLSRYPTVPWAWGDMTADFVIPADVATTEGIDWVDKPLYNRVYVHGQEKGVLGRYTRAGTDGALLAAPVVDPLITHADAVRQRGRSIIGDTGRIATVSLRMPVLAETGIIKPGKMIRYNDGLESRIGISRSVSVDVNLPTIYQTIGIETHV